MSANSTLKEVGHILAGVGGLQILVDVPISWLLSPSLWKPGSYKKSLSVGLGSLKDAGVSPHP